MMNYIIILIIVILIIAYLIWTTMYITKKYLIPKNELKEIEMKNQKYELLSTISVKAINEHITEYFTNHIQRYITYKFISKKINYIREEDTEILIKDITKLIYLEISELYIFYIKMIYSINTDDDLLKYINSKVKEIALDSITSYNSAMNP